MKFLASGALKPPRSIHAVSKTKVAGRGQLTPTFKRGVVLLRDTRGTVYRVGWEPITSPSGRGGPATRKRSAAKGERSGGRETTSRSLAAGKYTITGYRLIRRDKRGATWVLSATATRGIRDFNVVAENEKVLEIDPSVVVDCSVRRTKLGLRILVSITGEIEAGVSIYRKGRRIPIVYRVLDRQGQVVAMGKMEYG
ncbi:MAG TPA: hypothetical protein DCE43_12400 [Planctomycetaceae bacterium]|nr:hypothetical protein [Planctomycetaceae bacterium]